MIEQSLEEFFQLILFTAGPLIVAGAGLSAIINLLLATVQLQEQSIGTFLKLAVIFFFTYFFGLSTLSNIRDQLIKNIVRIEHVGHSSSISP